MCVCVFGIIVLNIFVERFFWELKMLTGSLVELHAWLHSYLCFSLLEKRFLSFLDTSSIPPWHLAICRALKLYFYRNLNRSSTARWIDRESSWTLNSFLIAGGSIELPFLCLLLCFSTPFSTTVSTDVVFLDTFLDRCLNTSQHLFLSRITEDLYIDFSRSGSHFPDLSRSIRVYSPPKHFFLPLNLQPT